MVTDLPRWLVLWCGLVPLGLSSPRAAHSGALATTIPQAVTVEVRAGGETEVASVKSPPRGVTVKAGTGRTTKAGPGTRQGVWLTLDVSDGLSTPLINAIDQDRAGYLWFGTTGGIVRYDGTRFVTFTTEDGVADNEVTSILEDRAGQLWFGTRGKGVSRYDGAHFTNFSTQDGLAGNEVISILEDRAGQLWFGTRGKGVSRYDGAHFITLAAGDGLAGNTVFSMLEDRAGDLWFGTEGGVSRYDGRQFTTFTIRNGLAGNGVTSMLEDRAGDLWFGTEGGVSRYDGRQFTTEDGLASRVTSILEDRDGRLWFATGGGGVIRGEGKRFTTFTAQDGLGGNWVAAIVEDRDGHLWFGTFRRGVSRYDGRQFTTLTIRDGLAGNDVGSILEDQDGHLWFGTEGGVSQYDGVVFQSLRRPDGLVYNLVTHLLQDRHGNTWITTLGGVTRYHPLHSPPPTVLTDVVADRRYGPVEEVRLPSSQDFLAFEFQGISFKSRPGQMVYVYRLEGYDKEWNQTRENRVEYPDLPIGEYTFLVKAVDQDLDYSENPAQVRVIIHPPYGRLVLVGGLGLALGGLVVVSGYAVKRRRYARQVERQLFVEMERELQTAHALQMNLMPSEPPFIPGLDLAGRCIPANHVGGDLFQYFHQEGKLSIALADVTGHAMEAAIPMVMFSGVLRSQMESGGPIEDLFGRLNRSLHNAAGNRTFVCFAFGTIDTHTSALRLSSAAFPYPYHFSAATGEITELQIDAYPLGVRPDTRYAAIERQLQPGDYLVFCSDGIIEATDGTGAQFGYERTAATLFSGCAAGLSAEALLERIVAEAKEFRGETPQGDDQTVVVLRVEA